MLFILLILADMQLNVSLFMIFSDIKWTIKWGTNFWKILKETDREQIYKKSK